MPKLGLEMEQGTVLEWTVRQGDEVSEGEMIAEVESEKSIGEVEAREDGTLRRVYAEEGDAVPPGTPIGIFAAPDADIADLEAEAEAELEGDAETAESEGETAATETAEASGAVAATPETAGGGGDDGSQTGDTGGSSDDVKASPRAQKRAEELGIDLATVEGTGFDGAITEDDVEAAADAAESEPAGEGDTEEVKASPRAQKRAEELGVDLTTVDGTGFEGAITESDVEAAAEAEPPVKRAERQRGGVEWLSAERPELDRYERVTATADPPAGEALFETMEAVRTAFEQRVTMTDVALVLDDSGSISSSEEQDIIDAAKAFIEPVLDRENLTARTGAHVTELTFEGDRATGVVYEQDGGSHEAEVSDDGEVVVAAGAIQSPQLLMLSGLGPADHLDEHDIDVRVDLPGVGKNLQDHLRVNVAYQTTEQITPRDPDHQPDQGARYDRVLTGAFERSDPDLPAPDIQYGLSAGLDPTTPNEGFSIAALPLRPTSRGYIELASTDPYDDPIIEAQLLSTEKDVDDIVTSIRRARRIAQADVLDDVRGEEVRPGPDVTERDEIADYCRDIAESGYHPVGTCKMGDDDMAVVDDDLRVHGVEGLRVIDASIMPNVTSGNTNAPTIAIAEKGADLLRDAR